MYKYPIIKPLITDKVCSAVLDVLRSGYLTEGPVTREFELACSNYLSCDNAIAVTSCTTGLELALRAIGVGPGDEVIVPDYTFPATASVVAIVGAKAVIIDVNKDTMLIDYDDIEKNITEKTKAILPVSLFGNPLDYHRLARIKEKHDVFIIEDAACAFGSEYNGEKIGIQSDITVFSFHPRKTITTGEGGLIVTNNEAWANWMNSYKHFGMLLRNGNPTDICFERIGSNYKLSNVLSAIGLEQLKTYPEYLMKRREIAERYIVLLHENDSVILPKISQYGVHNYQSFCVFVDKAIETVMLMRAKNIEAQIGTYSLHRHPAFINNKNINIRSNLCNSKYVYSACVALPLYHDMSIDDQKFIVDALLECST